MAADDFQDIPAGQGIPDLETSSPLSGNRPASGARRATPGEVLSQGFQGAQNAGDFLGLDTEFTASQDPNQVFGASSPLDLVPPPSTFVEGSEPHAADTALPASDPAQDFANSPSAFEFGEDLGSEEGEPVSGDESAPSRGPLLVKALLVAGLVGGAMFYGNKLYSRYFGPSHEVAVAPPAPVAKPKPVGGAEAPAPESSAKPTTDPAVVASKDPVVDPKPSIGPTSAPSPRKPSIGPRTPKNPVASDGARKGEPESILDQGQTDSSTTQTSATGTGVAVRKSPSGFPDLGTSEFEWASSDLLELIWRGSQVPLEAVRAPAKTLMPRVGIVRVFTTGGDVFDGRLYAVGQNRVWVDAEPGRIGLDGERIEKIEVLGPVAAGVQANVQEKEPTGKKRVRVRVPGGMLYGSVLKAEGEEVILALDDGGRVRVKASDITELGPGRAVVVRR